MDNRYYCTVPEAVLSYVQHREQRLSIKNGRHSELPALETNPLVWFYRLEPGVVSFSLYTLSRFFLYTPYCIDVCEVDAKIV